MHATRVVTLVFPTKTLYIEYTNDLPEYPKTDPNGYTYIVATNGQSQQEAEHLIQTVRTF